MYLSVIFRFFKTSKKRRHKILIEYSACFITGEIIHILSLLTLLNNFQVRNENKNALDFFLKVNYSKYALSSCFQKEVLEKSNKEELIAKLLETYEKIQEKDNLITKLEKDLVNSEMKNQLSDIIKKLLIAWKEVSNFSKQKLRKLLIIYLRDRRRQKATFVLILH